MNEEPLRVKVTNMGHLGWGVRIWCVAKVVEGQPISYWTDKIVKTRKEIGPLIQEELRMWDKCAGPYSPMADASRHRPGIKQNLREEKSDG